MNNHKGLESTFLKIFRFVLLLVMTIAIVAVPVLLMTAVFFYLEKPSPTLSVDQKVANDLRIDNLKQSLIDAKRQDSPSENQNNINPKSSQNSPLAFNQQALDIYKCADEFRVATGARVEKIDNNQMAQQVEFIRSSLETIASADYKKGGTYINSISKFACLALKDPSIIDLKKKGEIGPVLIPTLNMYTSAWNNAEKEVESITAEENAKIISDKALAITFFVFSGYIFLGFMVLALYLMFSRMENHMKNISESAMKITSRTT
jgi:hypothetical protein